MGKQVIDEFHNENFEGFVTHLQGDLAEPGEERTVLGSDSAEVPQKDVADDRHDHAVRMNLVTVRFARTQERERYVDLEIET